MIKITEMIDLVECCAKKVFEEQGIFYPQFIFVLPNKELEIGIIQFDEESKDNMFRTMRRLVYEKGVEEYFVIFESWILKVKSEEGITHIPKNHPERKECLIISHYRKDLKNTEIIIFFTKDKDGKIIWGERLVASYKDRKNLSKSRWNFYVEDIFQGGDN